MARTTIRTEDITASAVTAAKIASGAVDTTGLEDDIALLGFKVASNGSLAKYNLVDQTVDAFEDTSGVNAGGSTNEARNASNYYYGFSAVTPSVSGNYDDSGTDGDYSWYKWTTVTSSGSYTTDTAQDYEYLVVAGGGGAGAGCTGSGVGGGGGGAGGFRTATGFAVAATTISSITVGAGGAGTAFDAGVAAASGNDSIFSTITSTGGGGGGNRDLDSSHEDGRDGGSGGGGSYAGTKGAGNTPSTSPAQGFDGGGAEGGDDGPGGGGGASAAGVRNTGSGGAGGASSGGAGTASSISGSSVTYAGGGGGADAGVGGAGGGGNASSSTGVNGTNGLGGGAGAGRTVTGGTGGSGIVIIRRLTSEDTEGANMTLVSTTTAAQAAPTKGDIVLTYTNGAGTTTLDTDLTAEISADGGSTWTALALGSEGSTGSHNIATAHDVTISSTITAPWNMAYRIKTLNQSVSKTTRIQAVSLGWS